jgi:hypothetical protein
VIGRAVAVLMAAGLGSSACAADRNYSVTEFDKIDVEGPYQVSVETGKAPSARATGSVTGLDRLFIEVRSQRLVIRPLKSGWGERSFLRPGIVTIRVTVLGLKRVDLTGTSSLTINRIRTARLSVGQQGSSQIQIGQIDVDQLDLAASGGGLVALAGKALVGRVINSGTGRIAASSLMVSDLDVKSDSSGETRIGALRSAKATSTGAGDILIVGMPACIVTQLGAGEIVCGKAAQ